MTLFHVIQNAFSQVRTQSLFAIYQSPNPKDFCEAKNSEKLTFLVKYSYFMFQVPERLYQLVDRSTDGLVTADQVMEFIAGLQAIR